MRTHLPRKRFGQHFLTDVLALQTLVDAINPQPDQALVEIGPGLGAMSFPLLARSQKLTVIELDRDLAAKLRSKPGINVIEADVLKVDFLALAAQFPGQKLKIVGNLPYNISTPILFHLLEAVDHVLDQHFMLQKEVVDRMVAIPGTKDYGRLSVMLQWRYQMKSIQEVPPEAFEPPPRVHSAVVRMQPVPAPAGVNAKRLRDMVTVAFSQRRKILRNTLGPWLDTQGFTGEFDLKRRAEEVPVQEYLDVVRAIGLLPKPPEPDPT
jgi:16S rRNA (adenine1518-N6/adenine1519-N6)-dimethyltransferase